MATNNFFNIQSALTNAKIKVYEDYIGGYLPKLLMSIGKVQIVDLFCGAGNNGEKLGSPLVLINKISSLLKSDVIKSKPDLKIHIHFNDQDEKNIDDLKSQIDRIEYDKSIIEITITSKSFDDILPEVIAHSQKLNIANFFFLDPFSYSNVSMDNLKSLMSLKYTEVLLFLPIFHSYRFSSKEFNKDHKTRKFVEEFTVNGVTNYLDIDDFLFSVRNKLMSEINLEFVRPVLLDGGGSKNCLLLLTKHEKGMLLMNQIAGKLTKDGNHIAVNNSHQMSLFKSNEGSRFYSEFCQKLKDSLKERELSNAEIRNLAIKELYTPKLAKEELVKLHEQGLIKVFDTSSVEITSKQKWFLANDIKADHTTIFKWIGHE